jgi:hypothetical protein
VTTFAKLSDIDETFLNYVEQFCKLIFTRTNIVAKEINGNIEHGSKLCEYFATYHDTFRREKVLSPVSLMSATTMAANTVARLQAFQSYKLKITNTLAVNQANERLRSHSAAMLSALVDFIEYPKYGDLYASIESAKLCWKTFGRFTRDSKQSD